MNGNQAAAELADGDLRVWLGDHRLSAPCPADPAAVLQDLLSPHLLPGRILTVAVAGWPGIAPLPVPCRPGKPAPDPAIHPQIVLRPLPGLVQDKPTDLILSPMLRITGHLADHPDFDGVMCLPGRQTAWVQISAAEVVSFRSFLTGEILQSLTAESHQPATPDFDEAVGQAMSRPAALAAELSSVRARLALGRLSAAQAADCVAGLMIGAELAAARPWWLGQDVVVVGTGWLTDRYLRALRAQGVAARQADPANAIRAGMRATLACG